MADHDRLSSSEVAARAGVKPATLKRWVETGVIPGGKRATRNGWTPAAAAHARMVARLRARGHSLEEIRRATREGRLAQGLLEDLYPEGERRWTLEDAAEETGLEPELIERMWSSFGLPESMLERLSDEDVQALRYAGSVLEAGFPLVAFLQLSRVYGQALAQIADAEIRLFHMYVHEPLIREGRPVLEMAEEMAGLGRDVLPLASPLMDYVHTRYLAYYSEQDVIGHMEADLENVDAEHGRLRVAICFADLAGYTRFIEEEGEEEALSFVERFIDAVTHTLPEGARIIKTIGDEVMIVGQDVASIVDWAVGFQRLYEDERPPPRIGINAGPVLYRDGDYFGREVNMAARVVARARGGEVLVTDAVVESVGSPAHLEISNIGQVKLKGFDQPRSLCRVAAAQ